MLILLLPTGARAQSQIAAPALNVALIVRVYAAAMDFMIPRTLEPVSPPQITVWGLRGITALDPRLTTALEGGRLILSAPDRVVFMRAAPANADALSWATAAADVAAASWSESVPVRAAGTTGVIQSFFDEVFNHIDAYSRYVSPVDAARERARRSGIGEIGATLTQRRNAIVVASVTPDSPAAQAGLRSGDRIVSVNDQPVDGADPDVVSGWTQGPEGTLVSLVWRGRDGRQRAGDLTRALVEPETVFAQRSGPVLLIRITGFNVGTQERLEQALRTGLSGARPAEGVVLDIRGNRGGLVREAVAAADALLPEGVVAITAGRDPQASRVWRSTSLETARGVPLVVIVDGRSASAAEILAAALADRGRAVVIGSTTFGKGLVQTIGPLPDGGELFITWSRVLAPRGWPIQGLGLLPQVCTSRGEDFLAGELADLAEGRQPLARALSRHRAARAPVANSELLAIRDACPAAEGQDSDIATARGLIADPAAYAAALLPPLN